MTEFPAIRLPRVALAVAVAATLPYEAAHAQLEEVLVTAERREASVQDVPLAVSAYNQELIENLQLDDTLDLINVVPNLFGGNNTGLGTANMYYMRAQGNDESIATFDPPVGTYVDDVYITRQNANNFTLFDVERIEVLRGPQGTLYGRNTTGGAISIIMRKPGEEMSGYLEGGVGRWDRTMMRGSIDVPINDRVLTKFSYYTVDDNGYLENTVDGETYNEVDSTGWRAAFRFLLTDTLTWDVSVDGGDTQAANVHGYIDGDRRISSSRITNGLPAGLGQKAEYGNQVDMLNIISNLGWEVGGGTANLILGSRQIDQEYTLNFPNALSDDFFVIDNIGEHDMFSAELKWAGNIMNDRVYLTGGVYYMDEENTTDWRDYLDLAGVGAPFPPGTTFLPLADRIMENTTESLAVYAQADIKIGDKGTLTVGARYTDETKDIGFTGTVTSQQMVAAGIPLEQKESEVTPRIAYSHAINEDMMVYVSATNGFKSGGWNARASNGASVFPFGPENIWAYEAGLRADWLDGRLRTNLTAFYSDLEDLQTTSALPDGTFATTNAGGLEVPGFEAEITALPTENWQIFASLGLQDAKYVDLPSGCVVPNVSFAAYDENCNAAKPKRSPDETFTIGTFVDFDLGPVTLTPNAMLRYIGENVTGTRGLGENGSTTIYNLGLRISSAKSDFWEVNLECKNCGDETFTQSILFVPYYNIPETWMASVKFRFGNR
ncbi:MAG: TonB-dependent receptor [Luminiphilus sp.]